MACVCKNNLIVKTIYPRLCENHVWLLINLGIAEGQGDDVWRERANNVDLAIIYLDDGFNLTAAVF